MMKCKVRTKVSTNAMKMSKTSLGQQASIFTNKNNNTVTNIILTSDASIAMSIRVGINYVSAALREFASRVSVTLVAFRTPRDTRFRV